MSRRLAIWLVIVIAFVGVVIAAAGTETTSDATSSLQRDGVTYRAKKVQSGGDGRTVAIVPIYNTMTSGDTPANGSATGAADVVRMLDAIADKDDRFDGVILELDTPGGSVLAAEEIHDAILRLKRETKLPVLAWMRDTAASAGYYVAAPTDRIIAADSTFTGSIGVILSYFEASKLADDIGVRSVVIKSGKLKDMGNPLRALTEEEREVFQSVIDEAYDGFVDVVADGRDMSESKVRELADGRVYSGAQAKANGLVDELGLRRDAYDAMARLIAKRDRGSRRGSDLDVVELRREHGFLETLAAGAAPTLDGLDAARAVGRVLGVGVRPGVSARTGDARSIASGGTIRLEYRSELGA